MIHFFELNSTNYAAHSNPSSRPSLTAYQHLQSPKLPLMSVIKLNREFILPLIVPQTQTEDTAMNHEPTTHESPSNQAAPCLCPAIKTQFHPFTWNLYCLYLFIFINVFFVQISPPIPPVNSHHVYYKGTIQLHHCYKVLNVIFFLLKKAKQRIMRQLFQNKCARS